MEGVQGEEGKYGAGDYVAVKGLVSQGECIASAACAGKFDISAIPWQPAICTGSQMAPSPLIFQCIISDLAHLAGWQRPPRA